jgi:hypothetical protein
MNEMIAYCGLSCESCPIFWATGESDKLKQEGMRIEIARLIHDHYNMDIRLEDVTDCDGCRSETGRLFSSCAKCEIRKCAQERKLENCAYCTDYACEKLQKLFATDTSARPRLEEIRKTPRSS